MSRRTVWTIVFLTFTLGAIGMELWAAIFDHSGDTVTWTELISTWWPAPFTFGLIGILTAWIGPHFVEAYRKRGPMKGFKFQPVAYMTTALAVLTALEAVNESVHVVPEKYNAWIVSAIGVLTVVLGVLAHNRVTPTAAPKDDAGQPLVPKSMTQLK